MDVPGRRLDPEFKQTLTRVMFDRSLPCPYCDYSLSGLMGTRCPECGHNVAEYLRIADTLPHRLKGRTSPMVKVLVGIVLLGLFAAAAFSITSFLR